MGETELIVDLSVPLQVCGILMQLSAVFAADAVDKQVVVQMSRVHMGGNQHLEVWELLSRELHSNGVDLLGCYFIFCGERLHKMIELFAVCFLEPTLGGHHLQIGRSCNAVVT